jgi:hypothetical protein
VVKGEVCKTSIQRFESARRLQSSNTIVLAGALVALLSLAARIAPARADTYGAIAFSDQTGYYAWSVDQGSAKGAEARALSSCTQKGAGCKVVVSFSNSCGALAVGDNNRFATGQANSSSEAKSIAMNACRVATGGGACNIRASYCINPPSLNARPGMWQLNVAIPPRAEGGTPGAYATGTRCIKPVDVAARNWLPLFDSSAADATCSQIDFNASSNSIRWKFDCNGQARTTTEGSIRFDSPEHYSGTVSSKTTGSVNGGGVEHLDGKWIGPCAAAN